MVTWRDLRFGARDWLSTSPEAAWHMVWYGKKHIWTPVTALLYDLGQVVREAV